MTTATTAATITTETTLYHLTFHLYSTQKNNESVFFQKRQEHKKFEAQTTWWAAGA
jgi:hypothetical protein